MPAIGTGRVFGQLEDVTATCMMESIVGYAQQNPGFQLKIVIFSGVTAPVWSEAFVRLFKPPSEQALQQQ